MSSGARGVIGGPGGRQTAPAGSWRGGRRAFGGRLAAENGNRTDGKGGSRVGAANGNL